MDRIKVLYIDDDVQNLNIFKACFRKDFQIFVAESAEKGIPFLEKEEIHVVLTDQKMPHISGVEFLEYLIKLHPDPVRILTTAYTDLTAVIKAVNKGEIFRYIQKPWDENELKVAIINAYEVYQVRKENKEKTEQLRVKNEELSRFLYSISHELKGPVLSSLGIMKMADLENNMSDHMKMVEKCTLQLHAVINNISRYHLNLSEQVVLIPVNFQELLDEVIKEFRLNVKGVDFSVSIDHSLQFLSNPKKVKSILGNLLSNAIKFQDPGKEKCKVELFLSKSGRGIEIRIKDNGIGIPVKELPQIYKMFYRGNYIGEGAGLGLFVVKTAVQSLNGCIRVESKEEQGSVFYVWLPSKTVKESAPVEHNK